MKEIVREKSFKIAKTNRVDLSPVHKTLVQFPCPVLSVVGQLNADKVGYSVSANRSQVSFQIESSIPGESKFKVKCKNDYFSVTLRQGGGRSYLLAGNTKSSGKNYKKPLSKQEKLYKDIEEQLGIKITSSKKK